MTRFAEHVRSTGAQAEAEAALADHRTPRTALDPELRAMLPRCREPHGSLDDLLYGDATIEEHRAFNEAMEDPT